MKINLKKILCLSIIPFALMGCEDSIFKRTSTDPVTQVFDHAFFENKAKQKSIDTICIDDVSMNAFFNASLFKTGVGRLFSRKELYPDYTGTYHSHRVYFEELTTVQTSCPESFAIGLEKYFKSIEKNINTLDDEFLKIDNVVFRKDFIGSVSFKTNIKVNNLGLSYSKINLRLQDGRFFNFFFLDEDQAKEILKILKVEKFFK